MPRQNLKLTQKHAPRSQRERMLSAICSPLKKCWIYDLTFVRETQRSRLLHDLFSALFSSEMKGQ
jgi:hypothetical protein